MKKCWSCDRNLMQEAPELGEGWFKCECGATYIKQTRLKASVMSPKKDYAAGGESSSPRPVRRVKK